MPLFESSVLKESLLFSPLLEAWIDPVSGVTSYLLRADFPLQQSFYFVNPSFGADGRYYWFYCAFPPSGSARDGRSLAVADFEKGEITHFPETQFLDASPMVDPETGEAYWCSGAEIWKRGPESEAVATFVNSMPSKLVRNRQVACMATHLTFSADRSALNIDALVGEDCYIGHAPLDGDGIVLWKTFDRLYHHAQFSPVDPDLQLIAQDEWAHPATGEHQRIKQRMWLLRRDGEMEALYPGGGSEMQGHEWWSADGRKVWYVHYRHGVEYIDLQERRPVRVWASKTVSHAHADAQNDCLVADFLPPEQPSERRVAFLNRQTGREVDIVSHLPQIPKKQEKYHVHAHPQFCLDDQFVCYTTTVRGRVDVAFVPVEALIAATQS